MKKFIEEFKEFALKGNVVSLAVGVIIGGAFQAIVASLTNDIISPIIGIFMGENLAGKTATLINTSEKVVTLGYGNFITSIINFFIMALVLFILIRAINRITPSNDNTDEPKPEPRKCPYCCGILDDNATRCPSCTSMLDNSASAE